MIQSSILAVIAITLATATAAPRIVNCRVIAFSKSPDMPAELFSLAKSKGEFAKTIPSLSVETLPAELAVSEEGEIPFTAAADPVGPVIATAKIPPGVKNAYLFLLPDHTPDDAVRFQIVTIEDSPENTPPGGAMIHNASPVEARVTVGREIYPLPPGKSLGIPNPTEKDEFNMAALKIESETGGQWTTIKDGLTRFSMRDSYLIFTFSGTRPGQTLVKIYQKSLALPAAMEKQGKNQGPIRTR